MVNNSTISKKSPVTAHLKSMNIKKKPTTIDFGNRVSGSGQTQKM
jgi:hypothetical protein